MYIAALADGSLVAPSSPWVRAILLGLGLFTLFVVLTVPEAINLVVGLAVGAALMALGS